MKITCRNCNSNETKHAKAMQKAGFALWHIACQECGEMALSESAAASLGSIKTAKKSASSRANGKKGGRPKKQK